MYGLSLGKPVGQTILSNYVIDHVAIHVRYFILLTLSNPTYLFGFFRKGLINKGQTRVNTVNPYGHKGEFLVMEKALYAEVFVQPTTPTVRLTRPKRMLLLSKAHFINLIGRSTQVAYSPFDQTNVPV